MTTKTIREDKQKKTIENNRKQNKPREMVVFWSLIGGKVRSGCKGVGGGKVRSGCKGVGGYHQKMEGEEVLRA